MSADQVNLAAMTLRELDEFALAAHAFHQTPGVTLDEDPAPPEPNAQHGVNSVVEMTQ
jgi:hypothetical protein